MIGLARPKIVRTGRHLRAEVELYAVTGSTRRELAAAMHALCSDLEKKSEGEQWGIECPTSVVMPGPVTISIRCSWAGKLNDQAEGEAERALALLQLCVGCT